MRGLCAILCVCHAVSALAFLSPAAPRAVSGRAPAVGATSAAAVPYRPLSRWAPARQGWLRMSDEEGEKESVEEEAEAAPEPAAEAAPAEEEEGEKESVEEEAEAAPEPAAEAAPAEEEEEEEEEVEAAPAGPMAQPSPFDPDFNPGGEGFTREWKEGALTRGYILQGVVLAFVVFLSLQPESVKQLAICPAFVKSPDCVGFGEWFAIVFGGASSPLEAYMPSP